METTLPPLDIPAGYTPLVVTAHLAQGYSAADDWSPSLDGILAYWALKEQLGDEEFALGMTGHRALVAPVLPLARESDGEGRWWWVCSAPEPDAVAMVQQKFFHRRFDIAQATVYAAEGIRRVEVAAGPYKAYRHRRDIRVCRSVTWRAIGDAREVRRLLRRLTYIGFGHTKGWGRVWHVEVREGTDEDAAIARTRRPLPVAYAQALGLDGMVLPWGLLPPGRDPSQRADCLMPAMAGSVVPPEVWLS